MEPLTSQENQTAGLKPLSFAELISFHPAASLPVKPVSVLKSTQPEGIKPLAKGKQSAASTAEALKEENTALKEEVKRLKELICQKDEKLTEAVLKAAQLEEPMSHNNKPLAKVDTSLSCLTKERQQWEVEKSSFMQEIAQLREAQKEAEVTHKRRLFKKKRQIVRLLCRMDEEKTEQELLLNEHQLAITEAQNQLAKEREDWQSQITSLQQEMAELRKPCEEVNASRTKIAELEGQIEDLKLDQQKKHDMLQEAAQKAAQLEEQMRHNNKPLAKVDTSLSCLTKERQQWEVEKSSFMQEIAQLREAQKEAEVNHKRRIFKKKRQIVRLLCRMDEEKTEQELLLNDHQLALTEAQNQLAKEREDWQSQITSLQQEMAELRKPCKEDKASRTRIAELEGQIEDLKLDQQKKHDMLQEAARKAAQLEEQMRHKKELLEKVETSLSCLTKERQQWQKEKSSFVQEIAQLQEAQKEAEVTHKRRLFKKKRQIVRLLCRMDEEKTEQELLLNDQQLALTEAQNQLAKEREDWQSQITSLQQEMAELRKPCKKDKASRTRIAELEGQIEDLKLDQQKKHDMLQEAARKVAQLEEQMSHNNKPLAKVETSLSCLTKEGQQWEVEKSSFIQEIAQLREAQKEAEVNHKRRIFKKKRQIVRLLCRMDEEKTEQELLLNEHQLALTEAQNQLAKEREDWQSQITSLQQEMAELRKPCEEVNASRTRIAELEGQIEDLKLDQQKKHDMLQEAARKAAELEEQMRHKKELLEKVETSLSCLTKERQQWQKEKSSFMQEIAQLQEAQKEAEVTHKRRLFKKKRQIVRLLCRMDEEKTEQELLLNEHQLAITEAQNQLAKEREDWQSQITSLQQEMAELRKPCEEVNASRTKIAELEGQIEDLKLDQQKKHDMLQEAAQKAAQLEEQMRHNNKPLAKVDTSLSCLTKERQQWEVEKSSFMQEIAQLQEAQKEAEVTHKRKIFKKKRQIVRLLCRMDEEKTEQELLLNEHQLALTESQNQLAKESEDWQSQITSLQQEMAELRKPCEEDKASRTRIAELEGQIEDLKLDQQKKHDMLQEAARKVAQLEEQMSHNNKPLAKVDTSLSCLTKERQQWEVEKYSFMQEIAQLQEAQKEAEVNHKRRIFKKKRQIVRLLCRMDEEKTEQELLLNDHQLALTEAQNQLTKEREDWQSQITSLQQEMAELRKPCEEDNASRTRIMELEGQIEDLKLDQQKKDDMLQEAARKAAQLAEQMRHKKELLEKVETSLSCLTKERQQWQKEKSSFVQEIAQLQEAQKEAEVTHKRRIFKKKRQIVRLLYRMDEEKTEMWRYVSWTGKWLYVCWDHIQYDWLGNISFPLYYKVMFRETGYYYGKVYITGWHFMAFPMPQVGDFELMVHGRYEGGDGPIRKIRIKGTASTLTPALSLVSMVLLALCTSDDRALARNRGAAPPESGQGPAGEPTGEERRVVGSRGAAEDKPQKPSEVLKDHLAPLELPPSLEPLIALVIKIDNRLQDRRRGRRSNASFSRGRTDDYEPALFSSFFGCFHRLSCSSVRGTHAAGSWSFIPI
ncbi:uncharacterized protein LOC144989591 [Oryzias latipes]